MEVIDPRFFGDGPGIACEIPQQTIQFLCRVGCAEPILDGSFIRHFIIPCRSDTYRFELIGQSIEDRIERLSFEEERFSLAEPVIQQWVSETQIEELRLEAFQLAADIDRVFGHIDKSERVGALEKSIGVGEGISVVAYESLWISEASSPADPSLSEKSEGPFRESLRITET
jgi:hypothetical protein